MVETLLEVISLFKKERVEYCLIGGLAIMLYGGRANTIDIDFYILVHDLQKILDILRANKIAANPQGEHQIKAKHRNIPIDLLLADHYFGENVVRRARTKKLGKYSVKIASPEDIIVLKSLADRSIDKRDIQELREILGKKLDETYIHKKLNQLKKLL